MRLKESSEPHPPGYFIRSSMDGPERGPFTVDNLRDLAEIQQLTPDSLVRLEGENEWHTFQDLPEFLAEVFPEKKSYHLGSYKQRENPDAGYAPIDVHNLYRCDAPRPSLSPPPAPPVRPAPARDADRLPTGSAPPPPPTGPRPGAVGRNRPASAPIGVDVKQMLEESEALAKNRRAALRGEEKKPKTSALSFGGGTFFMRWGVAAGIFVLVLWIWKDPGSGVDAVISLFIGVLLLVMALALVVGDILDWAMNRFERVLLRDAAEHVDYGEAESRFAAGDWKGATLAYAACLEKAPYDLPGYFEAIAAATASGDEKKLAAFQALALKHLNVPDRNLLAGALHRHGLPPLPVSPPKKA